MKLYYVYIVLIPQEIFTGHLSSHVRHIMSATDIKKNLPLLEKKKKKKRETKKVGKKKKKKKRGKKKKKKKKKEEEERERGENTFFIFAG